jgi:hypothetical protein
MNAQQSSAGGAAPGTGRWYFCVKHQTVEGEDGSCPGKDRLGPYPTREAAEHALDTVKERNREWDAADGDND